MSALWSLSAERTTQNPLFEARLGLASFQLEKVLDAAKTKRLQFRYTFQRTTLTHLLIQNFVAPEDENIRSSRLSGRLYGGSWDSFVEGLVVTPENCDHKSRGGRRQKIAK